MSSSSSSVSITVVNQSNGQQASEGQSLQASPGDTIVIQGNVNPGPIGGCSNCVQINVVKAPTTGSIGTVGVGALGQTEYLYGPTTIPTNQSSSFGVQAEFLPTGAVSGTVMINITGTMSADERLWIPIVGLAAVIAGVTSLAFWEKRKKR